MRISDLKIVVTAAMAAPTNRIALIETPAKQGTGVRLDSTHVLTCAHVIEAEERPLVDGKPCLRVIGRDHDTTVDLALLEVATAAGLTASEWTEELTVGDTLRLEGFAEGRFRSIQAPVGSTHSGEKGVELMELPGRARHGMSGGLGVHANDPFACVGLLRTGGENAVYSTLIGTGVIREFLARHGVTLRIRTDAEARQIEEYLRDLREETGFIEVPALRIENRAVPPIGIEKLYIPLSGTGGQVDEAGKQRSQPLETVLSLQRVVIQGEAGSGKSTFLHRAVFELAGGGPFPNPLPSAGFPIYLRIVDLERHIAQCEKQGRPGAPTLGNHPEWLAHCLATHRNLPALFFHRKLERPDTVVLMDGLDESPRPETRVETMILIGRIASTYPACRFVVTTRPGAGVQLRGFQTIAIDPLSNEAREKFLEDWTRNLYADQAEKASARMRDDMLAAISGHPEIDKMARNPLMLTTLAVLFWANKRLPNQRAELYQMILGRLAEDRRDKQTSGTALLDYLGELAWGMQTDEAGRLKNIEKSDAAGKMKLSLSRKDALAILDREESRAAF